MTTSSSFADLGLADSLLRAIADTGYTAPTPIQAQAIPQVLKGGDLLAAAQTGTGKTAGFTLPILHLLMQRKPEARKAGRQVSTLTWEADIKRAVRGPHTFKLQNAGVDASAARAIRIFSRRAEVAPDIVCPPPRSEQPQTTLNSIGADARGDIGNVRPL